MTTFFVVIFLTVFFQSSASLIPDAGQNSTAEVLYDRDDYPVWFEKKIRNSIFEGGIFVVLAEDCYEREVLCSRIAEVLDFSDIVPIVQKYDVKFIEKNKKALTYNYINFDPMVKNGAQSLAQNLKNNLNFDQFSVEKIFAWVFLTKQLDAHANNILVQKTSDDLFRPVSIDHSISIHFDDAEGEKNVVLKEGNSFATDLFRIKSLEKELSSNEIIEFVDSLVGKFQTINETFGNNPLYSNKKPTSQKNQYCPNFELILKILDFQCFNKTIIHCLRQW